MAYGLKYRSQFDSQTDAYTASKTYTIEFLYKDYAGGTQSVILADNPIVHKFGADDPFAPIKGSSVSINLMNINGYLPLSAFNTEEDDGIMVKLLESGNVKFIGYVVNEDSYDTMVDFTHVITISANDSLGLLKGVILSEAIVKRPFSASYQTNGDNFVVYVDCDDYAFYPAAGDTITFDGNNYVIATAVNETTTIGLGVYNWTITVTTTTGGISLHSDFTIYLTGLLNLRARNSLMSIIAACVKRTNIDLITNIFCNISAYPQLTTVSHFEQTLIDSQTFISGETYENCYAVLEKIMTSFRCSIFQANGEWNIVHWDEMRFYTNQAIPGYQYDEDFIYIGNTTFTNIFTFGPDPQLTRPIYPLNIGQISSYKFVRKTFNYHQPKYLLRNYDLQTLGALLSSYTSGGFTIKEYVATDWTTGTGPILAERFIRVVTDSAGTEIERYLCIRGNHSNTTKAVAGVPFECQEGDKLKLSFSFKTNISQGGPIVIVFALMLTDNTISYYVDEVPAGNGSWITTVGFSYTISGGDNTNTWHSVEIESSQMPIDGLGYVYLPEAVDAPYNSSRETFYKDIRLEYIPFVNDTTKITGQIHKNERDKNVKTNTDVDIYIDNSPTNQVIGTLFQKTVTNLLQDRTGVWIYNYDITTGYAQLNEMLTHEELAWRGMLRIKYEGEFVGLYQNSVASMLTIVKETFNPSKNYIFGLLSIDYKKNRLNGTLYEIYDSEEPALVSDYTFKYIYSTA